MARNFRDLEKLVEEHSKVLKGLQSQIDSLKKDLERLRPKAPSSVHQILSAGYKK
jgi:uncharacterized protein YoxC